MMLNGYNEMIFENYCFQKHLLKIHELNSGWFRRSRLYDRALLLKEMDMAIKREGGVHNLSNAALKKCCYIRGEHCLDNFNDLSFSTSCICGTCFNNSLTMYMT